MHTIMILTGMLSATGKSSCLNAPTQALFKCHHLNQEHRPVSQICRHLTIAFFIYIYIYMLHSQCKHLGTLWSCAARDMKVQIDQNIQHIGIKNCYENFWNHIVGNKKCFTAYWPLQPLTSLNFSIKIRLISYDTQMTAWVAYPGEAYALNFQ